MKRIILVICMLWGVAYSQTTINADLIVTAQKSVDGKQYKTVSNKHVPYASSTEFLSLIPNTRRHVGQIAYIQNGNRVDVWQFTYCINDTCFRRVGDTTIIYTDSTLYHDDTTTHPGYQTIGIVRAQLDRIMHLDIDTTGGIEDGQSLIFDKPNRVWKIYTPPTFPGYVTPSFDDVAAVNGNTLHDISAGTIQSGSAGVNGSYNIYRNGFLHALIPETSTHANLWKMPDTSGTFGTRIKLNGVTTNFDSKGLADLGTVAGGSGSNNPDSLANLPGSAYKLKSDSTNATTGYTTLYQNGLKQNQLNGTGFVKASGTTISFDNSTYLTANQTITLSGDISGSGTTAITTTLPTVNSNVGTFGSAAQVPQTTFNAKGLATGITNVSIQLPESAITNLVSDLAGKQATITVLPIANGGTNNGSLSVTAGTIYYGDGSKLVGLAPGTAAQHLTGGTTPQWKDTTSGGGGGSAASSDSITQVGTVYQKRSWANLNDFTDVGTSASTSGTDISITGGTNVTTEYLAIKDTTLYENWKMRIRFKINATPSATTYGIGIGLNSINQQGTLSAIVKADLSTGGGAGKLSFFVGSGLAATAIATNGTAVTFALNDSMEIILEKDGKYLNASLSNLNNSTNTFNASYVYTISTVPYTPNTARFGINRFGGTYLVNSVFVTSNVRKFPTFAFVGDSKTVYLSATEIYKSFVGLSNDYLKTDKTNITTVANFGGGSDLTTQILSRLNVIIASKPKIVVLAIGSNDLRAGVSNAQWFTNYRSITTQLQAAGVTVWHLLPFPENSLNFTSYKDSIIATYPGQYIDTWNPLRNGTALLAAYDAGDGIHLNNAGNLVVFRTILKSGLYDIFNVSKSKADVEVPIGLGGNNLSGNLSIGVQSLYANTTGLNNTGVGYQAAQNITTGGQITAIGYQAAQNSTTSSEMTAVGMQALKTNTTGTLNTATGAYALFSNSTGSSNSAFGDRAMQGSTGSSNSAFGDRALFASSSATDNAAVGYHALYGSTASNNTAIGSIAGQNATSSTQSTLIGYASAGSGVLTGGSNTAVGALSLYKTTSGANNSTVGVQSLVNNLTGSNNVTFGDFSAYTQTAASSGIYIGHEAGYYETVSNKLHIANNRYNSIINGDFSTSTLNLIPLTTTASSISGSTSGGTLAAGNYYYVVTALDNTGAETTISNQSGYTTTGTTSSITINWTSVSGAASYKIYKGTVSGTYTTYFTSTGLSYIDVGSAGTAGVPSLGGSAYQYRATSTGFGFNQPITTTGFSAAYVAKSSTYTATAADYTIDCTSGTFTVTLPTAVGISGRVYFITNSGAGTITIGTTSSQTFTNVTATPTTLTMATMGAIQVQSNGANWLQLK